MIDSLCSPDLERWMDETTVTAVELQLQSELLKRQAIALEKYLGHVRRGGDPGVEEYMRAHFPQFAGPGQSSHPVRVRLQEAFNRLPTARRTA